MTYPTLTLGDQDYVVVPRGDFEKLAERHSVGIVPPPLPPADANGNFPALAAIRVSIARSLIESMNGADISVKVLATVTGIPVATLNGILKATQSPDEAIIVKIDKALIKLGARPESDDRATHSGGKAAARRTVEGVGRASSRRSRAAG